MTLEDDIERETNRDRALLSGPDRKWLLLPRDEYVEEHSRQYWGQRRDAVRNRIQNGLSDFKLLFQHLDEAQRDAIIEDLRDDEQADLHDGMISAIALLYELCWVAGWDFREILQRVADDVYKINSPRQTPEPMLVGEVSFNIPRRPLYADQRVYERGKKKLEDFIESDWPNRPDHLTDREVRLLWEHADDDVEAMLEEYREYKQSLLRPEDPEASRGLVRTEISEPERDGDDDSGAPEDSNGSK